MKSSLIQSGEYCLLTRIFHRSACSVTRVPLSLCAAGSCVCNPVSHTHLQTGDSPLTPPAAGLQRPAVCHSLHMQAEFRFVCLDPILFCHVVATTLLGEC